MRTEKTVFTIDDIKAKTIPIAKKYGVARMSLFGSYARGEADEKSDVDIFISLGNIRGLDYFGFLACFTGTYPRLTPYCGQPRSMKPVITGFIDLKTFKRVSTCFENF